MKITVPQDYQGQVIGREAAQQETEMPQEQDMGQDMGQAPQEPPLTVGEFGPILNYVFVEGKMMPFEHPELGQEVSYIAQQYRNESGFYSIQGRIYRKNGSLIEAVMTKVPEGVKVEEVKADK